jgi:hypothetical protein
VKRWFLHSSAALSLLLLGITLAFCVSQNFDPVPMLHISGRTFWGVLGLKKLTLLHCSLDVAHHYSYSDEGIHFL